MAEDRSNDPNFVFGLGGIGHDTQSDAWFAGHNNRASQHGPGRVWGEHREPSDKWFHLPGEKIFVEKEETRVPNASNFHFYKEDHTLGNLLRDRLFRMPGVLFSAYKVPHPSINEFDLRVQTTGDFTPKEALIRAVRGLMTDLSIMSREFTKEWELHKVRKEGERLSEQAAAAAAAGVESGATGTGGEDEAMEGANDGTADAAVDGTTTTGGI
ncbi:MAG: DNA-directed RNA polymerase II core subunit [Alyxoria varia]|nr:MAG: DNA-directed RNA polymerase II core subunit [Alyxoria varia]